MFCTPLSEIAELDMSEKEKLDNYLKQVLPNGYIFISQAVEKTGIEVETLLEVFLELVKREYLDLVYAIRCPECGHLIKKIDKINNYIFDSIDFCYACNQDIKVSSKDIVVLFRLKNLSFSNGQSDYFNDEKYKLLSNNWIAHNSDTVEVLRELNGNFEEFLKMESSEKEKQREESSRRAEIQKKAYNRYCINKRNYTAIWLVFNIIVFIILCCVLFCVNQSSKIAPFITLALFAADRIMDLGLKKVFILDYDEIVRQCEFESI